MNIRPLGDRVLIKPDATEELVAGVVRPEISQETPVQGVVMAVGDGHWDFPIHEEDGDGGEVYSARPLAVVVGDRVAYGKYSGTALDIDGEKLLIMREDEILAVLPPVSRLATA